MNRCYHIILIISRHLKMITPTEIKNRPLIYCIAILFLFFHNCVKNTFVQKYFCIPVSISSILQFIGISLKSILRFLGYFFVILSFVLEIFDILHFIWPNVPSALGSFNTFFHHSYFLHVAS